MIKKIILFLLLYVAASWGVFYGLKNLYPKEQQEPTILSFSTPSPTPEKDSQLETIVQKELKGTTGTYGVVIKNLSTGEHYSFQEHTSFDSASLYKLWVMAVVYEDIKNGTLTEDQVLSENVETLNNKFSIASESAELTEGVITLSVQKALEKMITISDNYAALLLTSKIRLSTVSDFLKNNGFKESSVGISGGAPMTTAYDVALFFEKLINNQLVDTTYSEKMLTLLKQQQLNNKIPKSLPDSLTIAHKTGELGEVTHDAGIVYTNNGNYLLILLSKSNDPAGAEERIANIAKAVYDYFESEK